MRTLHQNVLCALRQMSLSRFFKVTAMLILAFGVAKSFQYWRGYSRSLKIPRGHGDQEGSNMREVSGNLIICACCPARPLSGCTRVLGGYKDPGLSIGTILETQPNSRSTSVILPVESMDYGTLLSLMRV
jgi:hypothetical protein